MQPNQQDREQLNNTSASDQPNVTTVRSAGGLTIQPISSEDAIRSEAQTTRPKQPDQPYDTLSSSDPIVHNASTNSANEGSMGSLATESLRQQYQGVPASTLRPLSPAHIEKKGDGNKIFSTFLGLVFIAALGLGVYYFFFNGKLAAANLVKATVGQTTYLRPGGWKSVPLVVGTETYSNSGKGELSVATVTIAESTASIQYHGNNRPDNWYEAIRPQVMSNEKVDSIQLLFRNGGKDCTSEVAFNVEPDTRVANKTVGLALATGTCIREDGTYIVKRRTVTGEDDNRFRHIMVGASESDWAQNRATYRAILDSIGQVSRDKS